MPVVEPVSVIDIGCGGGSWLQAFQENGVRDLQGVDGPWIDQKVFRLAPEQLRYHDLTKPLDMGRRYSLASCVEVAEHLPAEAAPVLVENLVKLAPVVLFSAAVPAQYGIHHVNCQWPEYWTRLFGKFGYLPLDILRWEVWENPEVEWWYRQNILLYASPEFLESHPALQSTTPRHVINPGCFSFHADPAEISLRHYLKNLPKVLVSSMRRSLGRVLG